MQYKYIYYQEEYAVPRYNSTNSCSRLLVHFYLQQEKFLSGLQEEQLE